MEKFTFYISLSNEGAKMLGLKKERVEVRERTQEYPVKLCLFRYHYEQVGSGRTSVASSTKSFPLVVALIVVVVMLLCCFCC